MNSHVVGRPLGCLKTALRRSRQQKLFQKGIATRAAPALDQALNPRQKANMIKVSKFEVYPRVPSIRSSYPDPMPLLQQAQITMLDPTGARTRLFSRDQADSAKPGDVLMVSTKTGEPFSGVLLDIRRRGAESSILLRGQMMKTSVETSFKIYSPTVTGINIVWRRPKRARRAKLTYMRKPKHDMGSVDHLVAAWKQEKFALKARTKGSKQRQAKK
ncbi:hypothetical protein VHEMI05265 [[Torrubiella] hemipterigena]|uniref:Ribosomal protein L19 n=1 Tax=[Torrubiella] hemipterigena TaxID=1531966 RepID=A0A0A1TI94_9HYPO|nr:hypothetical protein VHEMI05265 [[Torrubiella] hemipterigena]